MECGDSSPPFMTSGDESPHSRKCKLPALAIGLNDDQGQVCQVKGWDGDSQLFATLCMVDPGVSSGDPNTRRVFIVANGEEKLVSVHASGYDTQERVSALINTMKVPFEAVRVYDDGVLVEEKRVMMRGS